MQSMNNKAFVYSREEGSWRGGGMLVFIRGGSFASTFIFPSERRRKVCIYNKERAFIVRDQRAFISDHSSVVIHQ
jgi:hypothetical protein